MVGDLVGGLDGGLVALGGLGLGVVGNFVGGLVGGGMSQFTGDFEGANDGRGV